MAPLTAPVLVAELLLFIAGALKLRSPAPTVGALRSVGVPARPAAVRLIGVAEVALATAAAVTGAAAAVALVAAAYTAFTAFVAIALRRGGAVASCGCVGRPDTPPTAAHLLVTGGLALSAAAAAGTTTPRLSDLSAADTGVLALTALATWLAWATLALLPRTSRRTRATAQP